MDDIGEREGLKGGERVCIFIVFRMVCITFYVQMEENLMCCARGNTLLLLTTTTTALNKIEEEEEEVATNTNKAKVEKTLLCG